jgi:pyruvate/2-oxoglutarate dehydrogenase complex dihydrolipoamide dehydrogenase (E3) component
VDAHNDWVEKAAIFKSFGIDVSVYDGLAKVAQGTQDDIADHIIIDLMHRKNLTAENSAVNNERKTNNIAADLLADATRFFCSAIRHWE